MTASNALGAQSAQDQQVTPAVRAQMADPAAWAVTAFATTSFMLGMYQTGILNAAGTPIVLPAAFFFGGLVQIIVAPAPIDSRTRNRLSAELSWATGMLVTYKVSNAPNITQNGP